MDCKKIGGFIAGLRKENNLTQQGLADKLGVTNKAVSKWECGEGYPEITMVPDLAEILGVSVDELLKGERTNKDVFQETNTSTKFNEGTNEDETQSFLLFNNAYNRFKNLAVIATGVIIAGVVLFYTLTLTTYYKMLGFGVELVLLTAGCIVYTIAYNNFKNSSIKLFEIYGTSPRHCRIITGTGKNLQFLIWTVSISLILAAPYLFSEDYGYVKSILIFGEYLRLLPVYLMIGGCATYCLKELMIKSYLLSWKDLCPSLSETMGRPDLSPSYKKARAILNSITIGLVLMLMIFAYIIGNLQNQGIYLSPGGVIILYISIASILIIFLPKLYNLNAIRPILSAYAIRNAFGGLILTVLFSLALLHRRHPSPITENAMVVFSRSLSLFQTALIAGGFLIILLMTIVIRKAEKMRL